MAAGFLGKKIGMTQIFKDEEVVPVTVINLSDWFVTQIKNKAKDGYESVQVGCLRDRYTSAYDKEKFVNEWLKKPSAYFLSLKEVRVPSEGLQIGDPFNSASLVQAGEYLDVFGTTSGKGFAGVMKRHNFSGGRKSHGGRLGRKPGSVGNFRSEGKVIKGKKLPGHMGVVQRVMRGLEAIKVDSESNILLVKGSVPGKAGSILFIRKQG